MAIKILLFIFLLFKYSNSFPNNKIIYNSNNILITSQDIEQLNIIKKKNNINLGLNNDLVEMVLIKKTFNKLKVNNPIYHNNIINKIKNQNFKLKDVDQDFLEEFIFFINVKNDIAQEFYLNDFKKENLNNLFLESNIKINLSKNSCNIIDYQIDIFEIDKSILEKILKFDTNELIITIENQNLELCLDDNKIKDIINFFNQKILKLSNKKFMDFIYD